MRNLDASPNKKNHDPVNKIVFQLRLETVDHADENAFEMYPEAAHIPTDGGRYVSHVLENG